MSSSAEPVRSADSVGSQRSMSWRVLMGRAFRLETPRWPPRFARVSFVIPVLVSYLLTCFHWVRFRNFGMGSNAMQELLVLATGTIVVGGVGFASRSICHAISTEMRDLVRVTGVNVVILLWVSTLVRWWTVGWSLLQLIPAGLFAYTLGGVTAAQLIAGAHTLLLVFVMTCSLGMLSGVLNSDSRNPETSTPGLTGLLLLLYNIFFVTLSQILYWGEKILYGRTSLYIDDLTTGLSDCSPFSVILTSLRSPDAFDPRIPYYWMHLIASAVFATLASSFVVSRFHRDADLPTRSWCFSLRRRRKVLEPGSSDDNSSVAPAGPTRSSRRCSDRPLFWKEVYFLTEERRRFNIWSFFYVISAIGEVAGILQMENLERFWSAKMMATASLVVVCIVVIRFDALMMTEMRERTWGTLMLLPVDPQHLLFTKFLAVLWEHRFSLIPISLLSFSAAINPMNLFIIIISILMASVSSIFLCQLSSINHLLGTRWWLGPLEAVGVIAVAISNVMIWAFFGLWIGFVPIILFWAALLLAMHYKIVVPIAKEWCEA